MLQSTLPPFETMYDALLQRDASFEGIFFAAIKTTGIFCRPTCRARKPKAKNTEFFSNTAEAIHHGYRPCKICRPMEKPGQSPEWLRPLLDKLKKSPYEKIKDYHLREIGLDPARVRRWFKKEHQMTFHAYQRSIRINRAFGQMKNGDPVTVTAYDVGFESLSGFHTAFKNITHSNPGSAGQLNVVVINRINTPLGPMLAGASPSGLCLLEFVDRPMLETQLKRVCKKLNARLIHGQHEMIDETKDQLEGYFNGSLKDFFQIPLDLTGTPFQEKVWNVLQSIPYGSTRSYKQQAEIIGQKGVVRAVARANGDNRISILIPCHRVVGSNGQLTGYGGGLWRKKWLLDHEHKHL